MKRRKAKRPAVTWGFRKMIGKRDLCITCVHFNDYLMDDGDCPKSTLPNDRREEFGAVRCAFYAKAEATLDTASGE
jgi:hypothetical protein